MITVCWPVDRSQVWISNTWQDHLNRPGYKRDYAGIDLAGAEQPLRPSQYNGKILQAMWSTQGYGYTTFIEYAGILRTRTAHQKTIATKIGQVVNPWDSLGILDSTGNSTGNHVHWETWLKVAGRWINVDPLNPINGIVVVNDFNLLTPLEGEEPMPVEFVLPNIPTMPKCKLTPMVYKYINVRSLPKAASTDLGDLKVGEVWDVTGYKQDTLGNVWFAVKKGDVIGWAAAFYNGEIWLQLL